MLRVLCSYERTPCLRRAAFTGAGGQREADPQKSAAVLCDVRQRQGLRMYLSAAAWTRQVLAPWVCATCRESPLESWMFTRSIKPANPSILYETQRNLFN